MNERNVIDNFGMDWFLDYGIWAVVTVIVAVGLFLALKHWVPRGIGWIVARITPKDADWSRAARIIDRIIFWVGGLLLLGISAVVILPLLGVDIDSFRSELSDGGHSFLRWLRSSGIRIALILAVAFAANRIVNAVLPGMVRRSVFGQGKRAKTKRDREELEQRYETLSLFLAGVVKVIIWIVAVFTILPELGVEIAPLLAGAGIVGLAIAFGAQNLIRDILSGLFIILEDQYGRGDVVTVAGIIGTVESLNIRRTELRDLEGVVHVVPNGEIKTSSNYTKDWSRIKLDVSVGYGEDLERVIKVMNKVGQELYDDPAWRPFLITAPQVLRVNNFGDSGIDIRMVGETKPARQWAIGGELRLRLKRVFDRENIEIPWPHTKLYLGDKAALDLLARYSGQAPLVLDEVEDEAAESALGEMPAGKRKPRRRASHPEEEISRDLPDEA